ncbi:MAG: hypothetical protein AABZ44_00725 [Elusimicrobiota bacterium]
MQKHSLRHIGLFICLAALTGLTACGGGKTTSGSALLDEDLAEGRVVDIIRVKKMVGRKSWLFLSVPKHAYLLEGYIRGVITDYDDHPIEGIITRGVVTRMQTEKSKKKKKMTDEEAMLLGLSDEEFQQKEAELEGSANFDVGVTDGNGIYRIRFLFPIVNDRVDVTGKLHYNPGWAQQFEVLGQSYEPQIKESEFRFYYDAKRKIIAFSEGPRKTVVRPVRNMKGSKLSPIKLPGSEKPETTTPPESPDGKKTGGTNEKAPTKDQENDDFFKSFNLGL